MRPLPNLETEMLELRDAVLVLESAIEAKDGYTGRHVRRVARFAEAIAAAMGLPREEVREARLAGLLHDVGKIWVADSVLNKNGSLDDREWAEMRRHPQFGWSALLPAQGARWRRIANAMLFHHERPDGAGYPFGLRGNEIPLLARIIAVADTFDAMTSDRPYRESLGAAAAVAEIVRCRGSQFCETVVEAFLVAYRSGKMREGEAPSETRPGKRKEHP